MPGAHKHANRARQPQDPRPVQAREQPARRAPGRLHAGPGGRRQSSSMGLLSSWLSSPSCSEEPMRLLRRFPGSKRVSGATAAGGSLPQVPRRHVPRTRWSPRSPKAAVSPKEPQEGTKAQPGSSWRVLTVGKGPRCPSEGTRHSHPEKSEELPLGRCHDRPEGGYGAHACELNVTGTHTRQFQGPSSGCCHH